MRHLQLLFASAALCCIAQAGAADVDAQTGGGSGPDPVLKSDPAPHPLSADQVTPASPAADPAPGAVGNAPAADPNPPVNAAEAKVAAKAAAKPASAKTAKTAADKPATKTAAARKADPARRVMVWVQPGHESFGIGKILSFETEEAERLRAAGRVRYASEAEIKAAGDAVDEVTGV